MHEQLWITELFNRYLARPTSDALAWIGQPAHDPQHPWTNFQSMEVLVFIIMLVVFGVAKAGFSVDKPTKLQHLFETVYVFLQGQADDIGIHHGARMIPFFGTLFLFILFSNLIGIIPGFESPTMFPPVTLGCAMLSFAYYNWLGIQRQGVLKYAAHFLGPMPLLAPLMLPIEIISHLARPMSLTVRLYANMFAGEKVTLAFLGLTYVAIPAVFMGLHVGVSVLQAYIFTLMTMIYVSSATAEEH